MEDLTTNKYLVKLTLKDGSVFDVEVAPPTFSRRDALRKIAVLQSKTAVKIDSQYKNIDELEKEEKFIKNAEWSCEAERFIDQSTIEKFKVIANTARLTEANASLFKVNNKDTAEFWESQDMRELEKAVEFFRQK